MMNLFAEYIHPLTIWLQANPNWALFITFIISLAESLAVVGSLVPGSVTMTAIGILAGSGIMRIDYTLIASSLGAVCGDSLSYALGYFYSDKLVYMWPFKKYPRWLSYGEEFFSRHGGKSVLIGRFFGPLRSMIPVIAGIMHMKQWRFLTANIISAFGWSLLYVMPGVLIGAAGHQLSSEVATRLFFIILFLLLSIWIVSLIIKWVVLKLHNYLKNNLHGFWLNFKKYPQLVKTYHLFTPRAETNHYQTAGLVLLAIFCFLGGITLLALNLQNTYIKNMDIPVYLFLQSIHSSLLEAVFIICTQLTSTLTIAVLYTACCLWFIYNKKIRSAIYMSALVMVSSSLGYILTQLINTARPEGLLITMSGSSFPNTNLLVATALYGFIFYYIQNKNVLLTNALRSFILIVLGLSGLGSIYLGDHWLTDVLAAYFTGALICLITCLFYRKVKSGREKKSLSVKILLLLLTMMLCSSLVSIYLNFKTLVYAHAAYHKEYTLDNSSWWNQKKPILPLYHLNRVGKLTSLLNIQYSGSLTALQNSLEKKGWETHNETFFKKFLTRINGKSNDIKLPLLTQLYENKHPELVMVYKNIGTNTAFQLTIWQSSYNLYNVNHPLHPLWIGTLYPTPVLNQKYNQGDVIPANIISYIIPALQKFTLRRITLRDALIKTTVFPNEPYVLLINKPLK
jgi:membrane protein DedA with SNARE-associated domain